jgi:hypothetical protein
MRSVYWLSALLIISEVAISKFQPRLFIAGTAFVNMHNTLEYWGFSTPFLRGETKYHPRILKFITVEFTNNIMFGMKHLSVDCFCVVSVWRYLNSSH